MSCPACGAPVLPDHAFCEQCGSPLGPAPSCTACGGEIADGYCLQCGLRAPAATDHVELILDSGAAGASDKGLRHSRNQDAMALGEAERHVIAVVCDGVSQSPRPETASTLAAQTGVAVLAEELKAGSSQEAATRAACARAARAVAALGTSADDAPACTYVSAVAGPDLVTVGWVGDSRAYWLPDEGAAVLLTDDDVASAGVLTAWLGADARNAGCRALGFVPDSPGLLMMCTDGLWGYLDDPVSFRAAVPIDGARALVHHALASGGRDNVTVVLIPVRRAC
ncbi:protein phosphatase 2C domain-containing protein [Nonomuraea sp. NPDC003804]|uniref:PP2C family serine/threonine-protein phosphatase n=1 Tax=Nonomuraea sp. NPDC003804 TaxID=3154547 RepID=UPI0033B7B172